MNLTKMYKTTLALSVASIVISLVTLSILIAKW